MVSTLRFLIFEQPCHGKAMSLQCLLHVYIHNLVCPGMSICHAVFAGG